MENNKIKLITRTGILLAVALVVQMGGFPQPITGPLINTVLYLAALLVGSWGGIIIGVCTPVIAFMRGILPAPLGPMIPFIALGNGVLVIVFSLLKGKNKIFGIIIASLAKYLILFTAVSFIVDVPDKIAQIMSLPQLFTALSGGVIAMLAYKALWAIGMDRTKEMPEDKKQ
ncbi:ECF transporter S component [Candidatus Atribacteria bacterium 4572_76]|nr:MAG: ECF transporter S component [Candidatus Atribacteria bacterium 4572_76]